jgi:hypothetical protein
MMQKKHIIAFAFLFYVGTITAQKIVPKESDSITAITNNLLETKLEDLEAEKKRVEDHEKFKLKQALNDINDKLERKEITIEKAQEMKLEAAKEAALNIDNKLAIIENQKQLVQRGVTYKFEFEEPHSLEFGIGNSTDENGSFLIGINYQNRRKKVIYDKRTYSDVVIAGGLNNTFTGASLKDSPYQLWKSTYGELGLAFRTRLKKETNFWRLVYGASFQAHSFTFTQNRFAVADGEMTSFETFPFELKRQKLIIYNLILPIYLEFGNSKKEEYYNRIRYNSMTNFKYGIGGFGGFNIGNTQLLRYDENNRRVELTNKRSVNPSTFVYGVGAYFGYGPFAIYGLYNFNPIFKNGPIDQNLVSLSIRADL